MHIITPSSSVLLNTLLPDPLYIKIYMLVVLVMLSSGIMCWVIPQGECVYEEHTFSDSWYNPQRTTRKHYTTSMYILIYRGSGNIAFNKTEELGYDNVQYNVVGELCF